MKRKLIEGHKETMYQISEQSIELINEYSDKLHIRKGMFVDFLCKYYAGFAG